MHLAIIANDLGASFIDKHITDLAPGHTVAVGNYGLIPALAGLWPVRCPAFMLNRWEMRLPIRLAKRAGMQTSALRARAVERFLRRHHVGVVLGEYLDEFLEYVPLLNRMGLPYVVQGHGIDVSARLRDPEMQRRYLDYASARAVLTRCEHHRQRLIAIGLPPEKIHVNPGGVDVPPQVLERDVKSGKRLLAIGVMVPKKGPMYLLEAFRLAAARDPEIMLDYIGGGTMFDAVQQYVSACGLGERLRLHGIASEETKQRLLAECGVFVQHSITNPQTGDEEGLPAAIQEAMANGMAVVSTRHSGISEAVVDGVTGLLVAEGDVQGMAEAFIKVAPVAGAMGREGRKEALAKHAWMHERDRLRQWLFNPN